MSKQLELWLSEPDFDLGQSDEILKLVHMLVDSTQRLSWLIMDYRKCMSWLIEFVCFLADNYSSQI